MPEQSVHESVLLQKVIEMLAPHDGDTVLDGTVKGGGHSEAILRSARVTLIGLDLDKDALARAQPRLLSAKGKGKVILRESNFRDFDAVLDDLSIERVDKALFDLGLSSNQLEAGEGGTGRGFSFRRDEPLRMTFSTDLNAGLTAADIVNGWEEEDIANVLFGYGEERYARRFAKAIVEYRRKKPIETSGELAFVIEEASPAGYRRGKTHPATRSFQDLRIAANDELGNLREMLPKIWQRLSPGGRIAIISFHSLEDRIVKRCFKEFAEGEGILLTKKPIVPDIAEMKENPRARSAKLRVIEKKNHAR